MNIVSSVNILRLYLYSKIKKDQLLPKKVRPIRASVRLTNRCNSKCITCNFWRKKWTDKVSGDRWREIINQLRKLGVSRLRFTGGETLLREDFFDILKETENHSFEKITLATNGLLLDRYTDEINSSPLTDLGVSIDGLEETNDRIRGVDGYFKKVTTSLNDIEGKRITIMTTLMSLNEKDLQDLIQLCEKNNWKWDFNLPDDRLYFFKGVDIGQMWPSKSQTRKIFQILSSLRGLEAMSRINDIQIGYAEKYLLRENIKEPMCFLGYTDIDIDADGNVYSGCYSMQPIGNILKNDLDEILQNQRFKKRLEDMIHRKCPGCSCGYELNIGIERLPTYAFDRIIKGKYK
jgi:MoaA/NifB/PqqE/SkfB family radical SAM enzyme